MKSALIGFTGFVGSNIASQHKFSDLYNSQNINDIEGKEYDLIVSAGTTALRWKANQEPQEDWNGIKKLLDSLEKVKAKHFILVSTVDVYPVKVGVNEDTHINESELTEAYGKHRFQVEKFVKEHFNNVTIARFPQLYGDGLKKNFIFDLIHDNALDFTHKDTLMQFYHLKNIWKDIQTVVDNDIHLINFATEPVTAGEIAKHALGMNFENVTEKPPLKFDFRTKYGKIFDSDDEYLYHKAPILEEIKEFIVNERKKAGK